MYMGSAWQGLPANLSGIGKSSRRGRTYMKSPFFRGLSTAPESTPLPLHKLNPGLVLLELQSLLREFVPYLNVEGLFLEPYIWPRYDGA